jgi:hypothetical protein
MRGPANPVATGEVTNVELTRYAIQHQLVD